MPTLAELEDEEILRRFAHQVAMGVKEGAPSVPQGGNSGMATTPEGFNQLIEAADKPTMDERAGRMKRFDL